MRCYETGQMQPPEGGIFLPKSEISVPAFVLNIIRNLPTLPEKSAKAQHEVDALVERTKHLQGYGKWFEYHFKMSLLNEHMPGHILAVVGHVEYLYETSALYTDACAVIAGQANQATRTILKDPDWLQVLSRYGYATTELYGRNRLMCSEIGGHALLDYVHRPPEGFRLATTSDQIKLLHTVIMLQSPDRL